MNSEEHRRWLDCDCEACTALAEVAHDLPTWEAKLEETKAVCPNWSTGDAADEGQMDLFKVMQP